MPPHKRGSFTSGEQETLARTWKLAEVRMDSPSTIQHALFMSQVERIDDFFPSVSAYINSAWIRPDEETIPLPTITSVFECFKQLYNMMGFTWGRHLILPTVIYVDRYISMTGRTDYATIFNWLFVSSLVVIKFWGEDEFDVDHDLAAFVSGISTRRMRVWEREFLTKLEYNFYLRNTDLERWVAERLFPNHTTTMPAAKELDSYMLPSSTHLPMEICAPCPV